MHVPGKFIIFRLLTVASLFDASLAWGGPKKAVDTNLSESDCMTLQSLRTVLFDNGDIKSENADLARFVRGFYERLSAANPRRETFERALSNRRLDALANLLVGDETCAAVAFNGTNLLIATNRKAYPQQNVTIEIRLLERAGSTRGRTTVQFLYDIAHNDGDFLRIPGETVVYSFDATSNTMRPEVFLSSYSITPAQHLIPFLSELSVAIPKKLSDEIPPPEEGYLCFEDTLSDVIMSFRTPINNPLLLRAEAIVEHLGVVARAEKAEKTLRARALAALEQNRARLFGHSLAWEAAKWFESKKKVVKELSADGRAVLKAFLDVLNSDFSKFRQDPLTENVFTVVQAWGQSVIQKIKDKTLQAPDYIATKPEFFIGRALRYFIDLLKVEQYVQTAISRPSDDPAASRLAELLLEEEGPGKKKKLPLIIDDLEDNVHAEMRLLWHTLYANRVPVDYIATSMLCCAFCGLVMHGHGFHGINGVHARAYANWVLSKKFRTEEFLRKFFGDDLYALYENLKYENISYSEKIITRAQMALQMIQSVGALQSEDLKLLGVAVPQVFRQGDLKADESDNDNPQSTPVSVPGYLIGSISRDGNCMYNAMRLGAGGTVDLETLRNQVADEIRDNPDLTELLINQLLVNVQDGDVAGFLEGPLREGLQNLIERRQTEIRQGNAPNLVDEEIQNAIMLLLALYPDAVRQNGFWGGNVELGILGRILGRQIIVHRVNGAMDPPINNTDNPEAQPVHLLYNGNHYELLIPADLQQPENGDAHVIRAGHTQILRESESGSAVRGVSVSSSAEQPSNTSAVVQGGLGSVFHVGTAPSF